MLGRLRRRLRALLFSRAAERELDAELRYHLERETEQHLAAGMTAEEARYAALRGFGGVEQSREQCRDARGVRAVEAGRLFDGRPLPLLTHGVCLDCTSLLRTGSKRRFER